MKVYSFAPLPVGVLPWNDPEPCVTVITKLTLSFGRSGFAIAAEQEPLCHRVPSLLGSEGELHHPTDFVPRKARCDVLLCGRAYSAMPLSAIGARVRVGAFQKRFFALAGEETTAIPLSTAYLRSKRRVDSEVAIVSALSPLHPSRAHLWAAGLTDDPEVLRRSALPRDFDFGFFNAAPDDQQIAPVGPGEAISLEGLCPDGAPCNGHLPRQWPTVYALTREGGKLVELPMTCDTIWIDTESGICELTLRGTWGGAASVQPGQGAGAAGRKAGAPALPIGLVVMLRDPQDRRGVPLLSELPRAAVGRALYPEDVAQIAESIDEIEEIEAEAIDEEIEEIEPAPLSFEMEETTTVDRKPTAGMRGGDEAVTGRVDVEPGRAIGRLGAIQLQHAQPQEIPALPRDPRDPPGVEPPEPMTVRHGPRRPATLTMLHGAQRPKTLPFAQRPAALDALLARKDGAPVEPPRIREPARIEDPVTAAPDAPAGSATPWMGPPRDAGALAGPRRPRTLDLSPGSASRPALPFSGSGSGAAPPPAIPGAPAPVRGPRRPRTLELSPGSGARPALPFGSQGGPVPTPALVPAAPAFVPSPALAAVPAPAPVPAPAAVPTPADSATARSRLLALTPETAPWEARDEDRPRKPLLETDAAPAAIERVGALPLAVDAAIQQEIWKGEAPLHEILARHGVDEVAWREHLRRRDEALRAEAASGGADRARAALSALDAARRPAGDEDEKPGLDLETYATLRALLDDSMDEATILASRGIPREQWERDHRLYRKRLREQPALAEKFRAALEEAKKAKDAPATPEKKKPVARKLPKPPPRGAKKE